MSTHIVRSGQSTLDIAIERYGTLEAFFDLLKDNGLESDEDPPIGSVLQIRDVLPDSADPDMVGYYTTKAIKVTSGYQHEQLFENEFDNQFE